MVSQDYLLPDPSSARVKGYCLCSVRSFGRPGDAVIDDGMATEGNGRGKRTPGEPGAAQVSRAACWTGRSTQPSLAHRATRATDYPRRLGPLPGVGPTSRVLSPRGPANGGGVPCLAGGRRPVARIAPHGLSRDPQP